MELPDYPWLTWDEMVALRNDLVQHGLPDDPTDVRVRLAEAMGRGVQEVRLGPRRGVPRRGPLAQAGHPHDVEQEALMASRTVTVEICGIERDVEVEFTIKSMGTGPSYDDPGDPPEIEVNKVYYADDPTERDICELLSSLRDLRIPGVKQYGFGFEVTLGYHGGDPLRPLDQWMVLPKVVFNRGRSIMDAVEEEIYENLHEHDDSNDYWDYDY
jgi:hypothetical protein